MILHHFSFNFTCTLTYQELRKPIQLRLQTRRQDVFFLINLTTFSRGTAWGNAFPKLLSRWQLPLSNSSQTKINFKSITAPLCCGNCISFQSAKLRGVGFPGDAVTNFLVTFQHVNIARWLAVRCTLWVALIWHFDRCRGRACLAGCLNSLFFTGCCF